MRGKIIFSLPFGVLYWGPHNEREGIGEKNRRFNICHAFVYTWKIPGNTESRPKMVQVQFSSITQSRPTVYNPMDCSIPGLPSITNSQSWLKLMSIESVMPSNHFILSHLLLLTSIFPSIRVFSNESVLCKRWSKYWDFSFSICPSNDYSGLISFRMDWLDLLAVQGTLKRILSNT